MSDDAEARVFISRVGGDLVLSCERCGARRPLAETVPAADQLLTFLDEHAHSA